MENKKILIFDFDGTLADTHEIVLDSYNAYAARRGYAQISMADLPVMRQASARENLSKFRIPFWRLPFVVWHVRRAIRARVSALTIDPEVRDALLALHGMDRELYVVSSNSAQSINGFLNYNSVAVFKEVHSVFDLFGKGDFLKKLIKKKKWDPANVLYVGDEIRDIDAAKVAGISCVAVAWGYNDRDALLKEGADRVIDEKAELREI